MLYERLHSIPSRTGLPKHQRDQYQIYRNEKYSSRRFPASRSSGRHETAARTRVGDVIVLGRDLEDGAVVDVVVVDQEEVRGSGPGSCVGR